MIQNSRLKKVRKKYGLNTPSFQTVCEKSPWNLVGFTRQFDKSVLRQSMVYKVLQCTSSCVMFSFICLQLLNVYNFTSKLIWKCCIKESWLLISRPTNFLTAVLFLLLVFWTLDSGYDCSYSEVTLFNL